jgi:DNA-binding transcriptional ArsR family regulator
VATARQDQPLYVVKADLFRSLAHPARVKILELLVQSEQSVGDLLAATGLEPSSLSQHLAVVKRTGLVESRRIANKVTYRVTDASVATFLAAARTVLASTLERARRTLEDLHETSEQ